MSLLMNMKDNRIVSSSFRDPSGFLFERDSILYRQINQGYSEHYRRLMQSGLYNRLTQAGLLIAHEEVEVPPAEPELAFKIIRPERIRFISYPYEWPFSMWKDAALATLAIQRDALKCGMVLKDASAYNIQFRDGQPVLIDSLSFEAYSEGQSWEGYRQFCQHFLAPLALMANTDIHLGQLLRLYIDGVPLALAARLLPFSTRFHPGLLVHIHLHAGLQRSYADRPVQRETSARALSKDALLALVASLDGAIQKLSWKPAGTEWGNYYASTNYARAAFEQKASVVSDWLAKVQPRTAWDLGANNGAFSRLASEKGICTVAFDIDPAAVEQNYLALKSNAEHNLLPLVLDLANPSPAIGWRNQERDSFLARGPVDLVLALALIHHLAISNNVPLPVLADFFAEICEWLVIEFVPKSDSQVQRLLQSRRDIFDHYTAEDFEREFGERYAIRNIAKLTDSERVLYLMQRK